MALTKWVIDPAHSEVLFKVKHLVISTVTGSFSKFDAQLETENEDFTDASIFFSAEVNSINTNNAQRDAHLKSDDFFAADKFPQLTFKSTSFKKVGESQYELKGDLTIRDVTKNITLNVIFGGIMVDFYGNTKAGFELEGKINRKDFGLNWSAVTEAGGVVVSDEVRLSLNIQMVKQS
ncbi:MAG: YceI family protein [Microscillaceae bacterium]|nr:YceI family protein [Microscillaceae bacterium]MDW8461664.1 YceI family protein [Cytophagales bacterium]